MNAIIFFPLAIIIFFILLVFAFPKLLYLSTLLYHAFKKDKTQIKASSYRLKDLKEIR